MNMTINKLFILSCFIVDLSHVLTLRRAEKLLSQDTEFVGRVNSILTNCSQFDNIVLIDSDDFKYVTTSAMLPCLPLFKI